MKSRYWINITAVLAILLALAASTAKAQEVVPVDMNCKVTYHNKYTEKDFTEATTWAFFANIDKAREVAREIERVIGNNADVMDRLNKLEALKRKYRITRKSKGNGRFSLKGMSGMGVVVMNEDDGKVNCFELKAGQTDYEVRFDVYRLAGAKATGTRKRRAKSTIIDVEDGNERFKIQIPLDEGLLKESSRLVIQTYAVDCMTDDTVAYCTPLVYEGGEYHVLQDKRMDYDFMKNDRLAFGYMEDEDGIPSFISTTIIFEKPDKKRSYKGPSKYAIEDYHHVYFRDAVGGSCLRIRPFKFLDFSVAIPEMELTEDFHEIADVVTANKQADLNLLFVQGKDILTSDSLNEAEKVKIVSELKQHGEDLLAPTIVGTASPEGSEKINRELADKRARVARSFISPYLSRRARPNVETKIYTWEDVAKELDKMRRPEEAQAVRSTIAANGDKKPALDRAISELPFYETLVVPIMNRMRVMKCNYSYIVSHVMEPDEAVEAYYTNKKKYLSGEEKLSSGDYFNLYSLITDSVEIDTVTIMAYKWLKDMPEDLLYSQKIAPYVYYKMARLQQRHGTPDTLLLKPFIDDSLFIDEMTNRGGEPFRINRQDLVVAQAMNYYQLQKFGKAQEYINWLKDSGKMPPGLEKLEMFMNLKTYYGLDEENPEFIKAKEFVMNSSVENRAILYTEIPEWRVSFEDTDDWINRMDDNNPKKWYLKGLLWSSKAAAGEPSLDEYYPDDEGKTDGFKVLTKAEEDKLISTNYAEYEEYEKKLAAYKAAHKDEVTAEPVDISNIKHYLSYFHHSFLLEPTFKRLYYNEGHIDEEMRKKYKYLKKDFAGYEEQFKLLKVRDDRRRDELDNGDGKGETESVGQNTAEDDAKTSAEEQPDTPPTSTEQPEAQSAGE